MEPSDDPWDWDVDRVVREFCTSNRTWIAAPGLNVLPDLTELGDKIAFNEVDGQTLLLAVDDNFLKEEFDLEKTKFRLAFKARWTIADAIGQFKKRSAKYQEHMRKHNASSSQVAEEEEANDEVGDLPPAAAKEDGRIADVIDGELQANGVADEIPPPQQNVSVDTAITDGAHSIHLPKQAVADAETGLLFDNKETSEPEMDGFNDGTDVLMDDAVLSAILSAEVTGPSMEVDSQVMTSNTPQPDSNAALTEAPRSDNPTFPNQFSQVQIAPTSAAEVKKTPKRLAPTLITTELDQNRDRELRTEADNVILNRPAELVSHAVTIGQDGKKRLIPHLVSNTTSGAIIAGGIANLETAQGLAKAVAAKREARAKVDMSKGYLGSVEMPVDDIFFSDAPLGSSCEQPETDDNFLQLGEDVSTGRRCYIARRMRYFLMSQLRLVKNGNKNCIARRPYPENLVPKGKPTSVMLAQRNDDGDVVLTRENVAQWPELDPDNAKAAVDDDEHKATFNLPEGDFPLGGPSSYDDWDPEQALRKWQHLPGDEVLPVFGESDEENEYDLETWREIEDEFGETEQPLLLSKRKPLTDAEVNEAMDEGMALIQAKWHDIHRPKLERKAYRIWMKSRRRKREQIAELRKKLNLLLGSRIPKLRDEILKQVWTTQRQVRHQCQVLEQTIFDREELLWEIFVLKQKTKPDKPAPLPKKEKRQPAVEPAENVDVGGNSESIGSTSDEDEDEDDLEDFIIDDDKDAAEHMVMAEEFVSQSEDEDDDDDADKFSTASGLVDDAMDLDIQMADTQIADTEDADDEEEEEEDVKVRTLSKRRNQMPASAPNSLESIDLTADTPPSSHDSSRRGSEMIDLLTPIKKDISANSSQPVAGLRQPLLDSGVQPPTSGTISVSSDEEMRDVSEGDESLPSLDDPRRIAEFGIQHWHNRGDKDRMLATKLAKMHQDSRDAITGYFEAVSDMGDQEIWKDMQSVMKASRARINSVQGLAQNQFTIITGIIRLFEVFTDGVDHHKRERFDTVICRKLFSREPYLERFLRVCRQVLSSLQPADQPDMSDREESPMPIRSARKARPRTVYQDLKAQRIRNANQQKLVEQQKRRELFRQRLAAAPLSGDSAKLIINDSKREEEGLISVHLQIGHRIKEHQIEGIRFMWNQIVAKVDDEELQGCLLAHTMGLGKTMQVITLLVAIAEAANSDDPSVSSQIPACLKTSKTLIICPPGLLDNWMDELFLWVPEDVLPKVGPAPGEEFRKIDASMRPADRLDEINAWYETGGILVMGFQGFQGIVSKADAGRDESDSKSPPDDLDYAKARMQLLEGPNIVIADEAHKLKNSSSKIHLAAKQFRTKSRIALTGSPLSNNVEEYHSMVDWVAPNYLGPIIEFRAKYVEPIQAGLYHNSTRSERRKSMKMLAVLNENIAPKVHRCGFDVMKDDLPPKTEFIIQVPLTSLQEQLYKLYVKLNINASLTPDQVTKEGSVKQTTLWSWLGMLALLCNHPACFRNRLETPDKEVKKLAADPNVELESLPEKLKDKLAAEVRTIMADYDESFEARRGSFKVHVLCQVLDAAREAKDKVLVFSHSRPTILFLENMFKRDKRKYAVLTGDTAISGRQGAVKNFNTGSLEIFLISTTAGGVGLNLYGANRVVIVDSKWSPAHEDQAVGRAYRLGQKKHVFVYRLIVGGTFEEKMHNQTVFKTQLAAQVVDKKSILANALRERTEYLFEPKPVPQKDLSEFAGKDPLILDMILASKQDCSIRSIQMSEAFSRPDDDPLTAEERKEVEIQLADERLKRDNPAAWQAKMEAHAAADRRAYLAKYTREETDGSNLANGVVTNQRPPPPSSTPGSISAAQQRLSNILNASARPLNQNPRARKPIMGSGTRMAPTDDLDSPMGHPRPEPTILDEPRPPHILELEGQLILALESKAFDIHRKTISRRAAEFVAYIMQKRPNEQYLLHPRIDAACVAFRTYTATTNDFLAGRRPLDRIVNDVLDGQLEGPAPSDPLCYAPAIEPQDGGSPMDSELLSSLDIEDEDAEKRDHNSPPESKAETLRRHVQDRYASILKVSIDQSVQDYPVLRLHRHDDMAELAERFVHEIDSAVARQLNKLPRDVNESSTSVVFARAADFIMKKMKDTTICAKWMVEEGMSVKKFVKREMKEFLTTRNVLNPASPRLKKTSPSDKVMLSAISTPTPQERTPAQNVGHSFNLPPEEQGQSSGEV